MKRIHIIFICLLSSFILFSCTEKENYIQKAETILHQQTLIEAGWALQQHPITVTDSFCERSAGGIHDFYSEGDYWWPDPQNPDGSYIRRDGESNPDNFTDHRLQMIRFSKIVGALAQAYQVTGDDRYVTHAFNHIYAWFVDPATRMNPNLLYAQAIKGITTGRGIGIIDTIHLMEVAQGILVMQDNKTVDPAQLNAAKQWFSEYLDWLRTHPNSIEEMNAKNNHGTCWVMQVASFARLTDDRETLTFCRTRYKEILLPGQMESDGSFPLELARTKPYGYVLFNLDAMTTICQILSTPEDNLWEYTTDEGLNIRKGLDWMAPYIKDKSIWPYQPDIMYWEEWPVAQPAFVFGAVAYDDDPYFELWKNADHHPENGEVERNLPVRHPLLWL